MTLPGTRPLRLLLFALALALGGPRVAHATHVPGSSEPIDYDGTLVPGVPSAPGTIGWSNPVDGYDWYCFDVVQGQTVTISATRLSGDIQLNLGLLRGVTASGNPMSDLLPILVNTSNSTMPNVTLTYSPTFSGPVTLWVSTWLGEAQGTYTLTMTGGSPRTDCIPQAPVSCEAGGPYLAVCEDVNLDGATVVAAPGSSVSYNWSSSNPAVTITPSGGVFVAGGAISPVPTSIASTPVPCGVTTTLTLMVTTASGASTCTTTATFDDTVPPTATATLEPAAPLPPASAGAPSSVCSSPSERQFVVRCTATDSCDPAPTATAVIHTERHEIPPGGGPCILISEDTSVACDSTVDIQILAPPCPANPPQSASSAPTPGVIAGETVRLVVTATDRCGNTGTASYDPTVTPTPPCSDPPLPSGACCPPIAAPPSSCPVPTCFSATPPTRPSTAPTSLKSTRSTITSSITSRSRRPGN